MFYYVRIRSTESSCPFCGLHWSTVYFPGPIYLGPASRECKNCGKWFWTGRVEWPELSREEKRQYLWRGVRMFGILWFCFLGYGVYLGFTDKDRAAANTPVENFLMAMGWITLVYGIPIVLLLLCRAVNIHDSTRRYKKNIARGSVPADNQASPKTTALLPGRARFDASKRIIAWSAFMMQPPSGHLSWTFCLKCKEPMFGRDRLFPCVPEEYIWTCAFCGADNVFRLSTQPVEVRFSRPHSAPLPTRTSDSVEKTEPLQASAVRPVPDTGSAEP